MGNEKSKTIDKSKAAQMYVQSKNAVSSESINIRMVQNVLLIWLDNSIDDRNADCRNTITLLHRAVNTINKYIDEEECIKFLETMGNEKACMIISGSLGRHIVPRVHDMSQVNSIFIFCSNKKYHEQWAKDWSKIKGVFTEIAPICEALKQAAQQCEQDSISISFIATGSDMSKENFDQLEPSFMYTQIMKEILLSIEFEQQHIDEFTQYCREAFTDNDYELNNVKKFERQYRDQTPIWWYTCDCFLYPMLNRALRLMDADLIVKMGFFIGDLHRHIEKLHQKQFGGHRFKKSFIVYRGQGMSRTDFEQMSNTIGGLLSFNNFLSTSNNRNVSLEFANCAMTNAEMIGILFVMTIDPTQSTTPFASVTGVSYFEDKEDEVLFSMHTVFRIGDITPIGENNRLFQVKLTLTSDKDLRTLTNRIREETFPGDKGWHRLGLVLMKMGQFDKAQQVYEVLLEQTTDEFVKGSIYDRLGLVHYNKGYYQEAITFYEKALEIYERTLSPTHSNMSVSYNNIGLVYDSMGDYPKALLSHEKALAIKQQSLPLNHPDLAMSYNNIGNVYYNMGDYPEALSYYEKDLEISKQSLPSNHPDLAKSYITHGLVYDEMMKYSEAIVFYEKAIKIQRQSLPSNHSDLAYSYGNIGNVYEKMGDYPKALSSYEKALAIRQQSLPPNHPDLASSYNNIGLVYQNMDDYSKAHSFYERAVDIGAQSLPSGHPNLQKYRNNLERVKSKL